MTHQAALHLSDFSKILLPQNINILRWTDHLSIAGKKSGTLRYKKYGTVYDENKRKEAWLRWWKKTGQYKDIKILRRQSITIPKKSIELAEFVGIVMGDGNINNYCVTVTLDTIADREYIIFVQKLMNKLFGVAPSLFVHKDCRATDVIIRRRHLVNFCESIGMKRGHKLKNGLDIPKIIRNILSPVYAVLWILMGVSSNIHML